MGIKTAKRWTIFLNTVIGTLAIDGWAVPNVTAHPSTASGLLYLSLTPKFKT